MDLNVNVWRLKLMYVQSVARTILAELLAVNVITELLERVTVFHYISAYCSFYYLQHYKDKYLAKKRMKTCRNMGPQNISRLYPLVPPPFPSAPPGFMVGGDYDLRPSLIPGRRLTGL
jgi:hypothetical protein